MIELTETPTFVIDDYCDATSIVLFDYFDFEEIPYEVLELSSEELPYRGTTYYPVVLHDIGPGIDYDSLVNPRALYKAQDQEMVITFIYTGIKDPTTILREELMRWIIANGITIRDVRFISSNKASEITPPFIFFPFAELDAYMDMKNQPRIEKANHDHRENIFACDIKKDTAHGRLFGATIWYHALSEYSYFNYGEATNTKEITKSSIYSWDKQWASTGTLMDMFGQQLPITTQVETDAPIYDQAYWNLIVGDSFSLKELSVNYDMFKPINNLQPFILIGPPSQTKLLKSLGYETFENFVNEMHDTIIDDETRMQALFRLVYEMVHYDDDELVDINKRVAGICKHNQKHFLASKRFRLIDLLKKLHDDRS